MHHFFKKATHISLVVMLLLLVANKAESASLLLKSPTGGEFWQVGKTPSIMWEARGLTEVQIEYSINNGATWNTVASVAASARQYAWTVPATPSTNCIVRLTSGTLVVKSAKVF